MSKELPDTIPNEALKYQEAIRKLVYRYKATSFLVGENNGVAALIFEMSERRIKFSIPIRTGPSQAKTEQLQRTAWRCLLLAIKAKLECIESGISSFDNEFLAYIMMPNGGTVGDEVIPMIQQGYKTGKMPPLLPGRV